MKSRRLPRTDSIQEHARFWDTHEITDFEDELEEVTEPVFDRRTLIPLDLKAAEAEAVRQMAQAIGVKEGELIRRWIREKLRTK